MFCFFFSLKNKRRKYLDKKKRPNLIMESNTTVINEEWIRKKLNITHDNLGAQFSCSIYVFLEYLLILQNKKIPMFCFKFVSLSYSKRRYQVFVSAWHLPRENLSLGQLVFQIHSPQRTRFIAQLAD